MAARDRLQQLLQQNSVTGIDFVYVGSNQTTLDVYFFEHNDRPQAASILGPVALEQISIYSPTGALGLPEIAVTAALWTVVDNRDVLRLTTVAPHGFALYRLRIDHPNLEQRFNDIVIPLPDRLQKLLQQNEVTGLDCVYVHPDQQTLDLFFFQHNDPPQASDILGQVLPTQVQIYNLIGGEGFSQVLVDNTAWIMVGNRNVLRLTTVAPGGFTLYRLRIDHPDPDMAIGHPNIDQYFNNIIFSFKANCPSDVDCEPDTLDCPPEDWQDFPVDYRARDFNSFRRALLDFASQRYPEWADRLEADVGMLLVEAMSALGDELAYYQDRIAREAYLETASQRRSLRHHARLVDYEPHNGLAAQTWLDITVSSGQSGALPAGADVWALSDWGRRIPYEVGRGLADAVNALTFAVAASRNALAPHLWDEDDLCLPLGAIEMFIKGRQAAELAFNDPPENPTGKWVLLKTTPANPADPGRRHLVRLIELKETRDPVFNEDITRVRWEDAQALPFELNLTELTMRANLVPATAGRTVLNRFTIGVDPATLPLPESVRNNLRRAVERAGAGSSVAYLFSLTRPQLPPDDIGQPEAEEFLTELTWPEGRILTWLGQSSSVARPEIRLVEVEFDGVNWIEQSPPWDWRRSLLGVSSSQPGDRHFTLEDGAWDRVVGYWRSGQEVVHEDYASNEGFTIRFGDDEFGQIPAENTVFEVTYRLGNGRAGNVPADTITYFDPALTIVQAVTNPLPASGGQKPETPTEVRQLAPDAFRYLTYRAVRPEDYAEAAERLPWVQRAGAKFRWTGSWLTLFATPDPLNAVTVSSSQRAELTAQLNRFRQAGREVVVANPRYADLDLKITMCVQPFAYPGEVKEAVLAALLGQKGPRPQPGFFSANNFTFGISLKRSALESVIQATPGVRAVKTILIRRRGWFNWRSFSELAFEVASDEVIRVENAALYPARGSVRLIMEGGA
ncbi:MAG: baseplate J/gp47 family protein [Anaerolineae bacterium]|nr:baseplate J/gp47 family protein [Anaerolineae bacterium]